MLYKDLDNILESKFYQQNEITKTTDMRTLLRKYRWRWVGHDLRMSDNDITRVALKSTLEGKRRKGWPRTTSRRTVDKVPKYLNLNHLTWGEEERLAKNKEEWKSLVLVQFASECNKDLVGNGILTT